MAANKSPLFGRSQSSGPVVFTDETATTGDIWFVDSGATSTGGTTTGYGRIPSRPNTTLASAMVNATASNGDRIYVMPGHAETIATTVTVKAGVSIIGLGEGANRPQLTVSGGIAGLTCSAANAKIMGIQFNEPGASTDSAIAASAADLWIANCRFDLATGENCITVSAAGDRLTVTDNVFNVTGDGPNGAIKLASAGTADVEIHGNKFICSDGTNAFDAGAIEFAAAANVLVHGNKFLGNGAASTAVSGSAANLANSTVKNNIYGDNAISADPGRNTYDSDAAAIKHLMVNNGRNWWVDATNGHANNDGRSPERALAGFDAALALMTARDTLFVGQGGYTGDFVTPLNSVAPFCRIVGMNATETGFGPWFASTTATEPTLNVRARGWRITGIEWDSPTTDASIQLTTSGTSNANYCQIDHCLFTGAQTGQNAINWVGAPTYTWIEDCQFDGYQASAFICTDSGTDVPRWCTILHNFFHENVGHMNMNPRGFKSSRIEGNVFQRLGVHDDCVKIIDFTGGGYNMVVGNYFPLDDGNAGNQYDEAGGLLVPGTSDGWPGNFANFGVSDLNPGGG